MMNYRPSTTNARSILDTPAPSWLAKKPELAEPWARCLRSASKHGRLEDHDRGAILSNKESDFFLIIRGCVVVTSDPLEREAPPLFVSALQRGDIITPTIFQLVPVTLTVRSASTLLRVPKASLASFASEIGLCETLFMAVNMELTKLYAAAAQSVRLKDQDRILRVIESLALHSDAVITAVGNEVEVSKEEIRTLAGVQKRSATRAFHNLQEDGVIAFNGYKRVYYKGNISQ